MTPEEVLEREVTDAIRAAKSGGARIFYEVLEACEGDFVGALSDERALALQGQLLAF